MKKHSKLLKIFCSICMVMGTFITFHGFSLIYFGEPDFPQLDN